MFDFEELLRKRVRFDSPRGQLTVEDLFDLPLTSPSGNKANLDDIAKGLYAKLPASGAVVSFVDDAPPAQSLDQKRFDVVRYVIAVKKAENAKALKAKENREQRERIRAFIAEKQDADLRGKPLDDLKAMLANLPED